VCKNCFSKGYIAPDYTLFLFMEEKIMNYIDASLVTINDPEYHQTFWNHMKGQRVILPTWLLEKPSMAHSIFRMYLLTNTLLQRTSAAYSTML
jgi:hypothetical protein